MANNNPNIRKRARVSYENQYFIPFSTKSAMKCRIFSAVATKFRIGSDAAGRNVETTSKGNFVDVNGKTIGKIS